MTSLSLSGCGRGLSGCGQGQSECGCGLSGCGCGLSCCGRGQRGDSFDVTLASCLPPSYTEVLQARTLTLMPTTTSPFINSDVTEAAVDARFLHQNQLPRAATVPADWVYEGSNEGKMGELATVDVVGQMSTVGDDSSSGDVLSRPVISTFTRSVSEDLRVLTSRLMKSHVEDLTLHRTPRGSGAGYGVGCHELLQSSLAAELSSSELPRAGQEGWVVVISTESCRTVIFVFRASRNTGADNIPSHHMTLNLVHCCLAELQLFPLFLQCFLPHIFWSTVSMTLRIPP